MCYPQKIPLPITILYVITVVNLTVLLNLTLVEANVIVLTNYNHTVEEGIMDLPAQFGPGIPEQGVWGHLIYAEPRDACKPIKPPPKDVLNATGIQKQWIVLIKRNGCNFDTKVLNAQNQGYVAAIVHNVDSDKLVAMSGKGNASKVEIPSVFIGAGDAKYLFENFNDNLHFTIVVDPNSPFIDPNTAKMIFAIFGIVIGSCFVTMIIFAIVKWVRDFRRKRRSRLSKQHLKKLPIKKFKKGDKYDVCAICLDEYEEGNKLRVLPCNHVYHLKCIDPWLTKNKKTCPICKQKVIPGRSSDDSSSDSDSYDGTTGAEASGESEPLLGASGRSTSSRSTGNTFDNSGIPERFRTIRQPSSEFDDEDDSSSDNDSLVPVASRYQSSVEVHSEPDYRRNRMIRPPRRIGRLAAQRYALVDENPRESNGSDTGKDKLLKSSNAPKPERRAWEYGISPQDNDECLSGKPMEADDTNDVLEAYGGDTNMNDVKLDDHLESHMESLSASKKKPNEAKKTIDPELAASVLKKLTETPDLHKKKKSKSNRKSPSTRSIDSAGSKTPTQGNNTLSNNKSRSDNEKSNSEQETGNNSNRDTDSIGSNNGINGATTGETSGSDNRENSGNHNSEINNEYEEDAGAVGGSDVPLLEEPPEVDVVSSRRASGSKKKPKKRRKVDKNA